MAQLDEAGRILGFGVLRQVLSTTAAHDRRFLALEDLGERRASLVFALKWKSWVIDAINADWVPTGQKTARSTGVSARSCSGCTKTDFWNINTHAKPKQVKCTFRGPNGSLSPSRPLFPRTMQSTSCTLRKGVVHAELSIRVPKGVTAKGSQPVTVTAHWR